MRKQRWSKRDSMDSMHESTFVLPGRISITRSDEMLFAHEAAYSESRVIPYFLSFSSSVTRAMPSLRAASDRLPRHCANS